MGTWMVRGSLVVAAALLVGAPACGSDDLVQDEDDDGSTSSSTTSGSGGAGGNGATSSSSSGGQGGMGQGGMGQGGMGQGGASMICEPDPADTACSTCAKDNCCMQLEACELDMQCGCVADCILMGGDAVQCGVGCGAIPPTKPTTNVGMCVNDNCSINCQM